MSWLSESEVSALKVGDEVGVTPGSNYAPPTIERITRRTPKMVMIGTTRFNKRGRSIGATWHAKFLLSPESAREQIADYEEQHGHALIVRYLRDYPWHKLSLEQCREVKTLLTAFASSKDAAAAPISRDVLNIGEAQGK